MRDERLMLLAVVVVIALVALYLMKGPTMGDKRLMKRVLGRTVDERIWTPALALARSGVSGQAVDLQFIQHETQNIEADLGRWYRENPELRDAALQAVEAERVSLQARADGGRVDQERTESTRRAERADPHTPDGRFLIEEGERARAARRDSQHALQVADNMLALRREAQRNAEANVVDQLHLAALQRRRALDEFVDVLNALLRYYGHGPVEALPAELTDQLVRRAVRPIDLQGVGTAA